MKINIKYIAKKYIWSTYKIHEQYIQKYIQNTYKIHTKYMGILPVVQSKQQHAALFTVPLIERVSAKAANTLWASKYVGKLQSESNYDAAVELSRVEDAWLRACCEVIQSSQDGQEGEARSLPREHLFPYECGEVYHGLLGLSASATALSWERQKHAYNIIISCCR